MIPLQEKDKPILCSLCIILFVIGLFYIYFKGPIRGDEREYAEMSYSLVEDHDGDFWDLRNYFYPLLIVSVYFLGSVFIGSPTIDHFIVIARLINIFFVIGSTIIFYFIFEKKSGSGALLSAYIFSFNWLLIYWGFRSTTQAPSVFFLLFSIYLMQKSSLYSQLLCGISLGCSFACWYGVIIVVLPFIVVSKSYHRLLSRLFGFLFVGVIFVGLLDFWMYGSFLQSAKSFFTFNIVEGQSAAWDDIWGQKPWYFYFGLCIPLVLGPLSLFYFLSFKHLFKGDNLLDFSLLSSILFLIIFTLIQHKEYRFFLVFYPLFILSSVIELEKRNVHPKIVFFISAAYNAAVMGGILLKGVVII